MSSRTKLVAQEIVGDARQFRPGIPVRADLRDCHLWHMIFMVDGRQRDIAFNYRQLSLKRMERENMGIGPGLARVEDVGKVLFQPISLLGTQRFRGSGILQKAVRKDLPSGVATRSLCHRRLPGLTGFVAEVSQRLSPRFRGVWNCRHHDGECVGAQNLRAFFKELRECRSGGERDAQSWVALACYLLSDAKSDVDVSLPRNGSLRRFRGGAYS